MYVLSLTSILHHRVFEGMHKSGLYLCAGVWGESVRLLVQHLHLGPLQFLFNLYVCLLAFIE